MNISIALPAMAPQTTGHPASLPPDPARPDSTQTVTPASESETPGQTGHRQAGEQQNSAPPSLMQIRIMELLAEQARSQETTETDAPAD